MSYLLKTIVLAAMLIATTAHADSVPPRTATTTRDDKGIWFITASDLYAGYEAMGYAVAQDRLWQMDLFRRSARGRLAELFGASQLPTDIFSRTVGYSNNELQMAFNNLEANAKIAVQAYVDGVNRRVTQVTNNQALKPFEYHALGINPVAWTTGDVLMWSAGLLRNFDAEGLTTGQLTNSLLLQELDQKFPSQSDNMFDDLRWINDPRAQTMIRSARTNKGIAKSIDPEAIKQIQKRFEDYQNSLKKINAHVKFGSYAWAFSGDKTQSGRPILYSGPQMGFSTPSIVAEGSVKIPGFTVSGMVVPGVPGIIIGRTLHNTWSLQVGHAHTTDYYLESPSAPVLHRTEIIKVAGQADVSLPVYRTVHGPVIQPMPYNPGTVGSQPIFSWKYAHFGVNREFRFVEALLKMSSATTVNQFRNAMDILPVSLHITYADNAGNIAYMMSGDNPKRPQNVDTRLPQLGDGTQEWVTPLDLKAKPFERNPSEGYYAGWNNKSKADYDNNNNLLGIFQMGRFHRAHFIEEQISGKMSFVQLRRLASNIAATDSFGEGGNPFAFVKNRLFAAIDAQPTPARNQAKQLLDGWNGRMVTGGPEQWVSETVRADAWVLADAWLREFLRVTFEDELATASMTYLSQDQANLFNTVLHQLDGNASGVPNKYDWFQDTSGSGKPTTPRGLMLLALDNALAQLGPRPYNVPRGEIIYADPFYGEIGRTLFGRRSTYGHIVEMGTQGPVRIESLFPLGQSGDVRISNSGSPIFDPNYLSMKPLFDAFEHRPFPLF